MERLKPLCTIVGVLGKPPCMIVGVLGKPPCMMVCGAVWARAGKAARPAARPSKSDPRRMVVSFLPGPASAALPDGDPGFHNARDPPRPAPHIRVRQAGDSPMTDGDAEM